MLFNHTKNYTISGNGSWSGSGSFTKTGTGRLTIGTTNSLSGDINISDGMVSFLSGANPGPGSITLADGGAFEVQGGAGGSVITSPITVAPGDTATISSGQLATSFNSAIATTSTNSFLNISNGVSFGGVPASQLNGFYGTIRIVSGATLRFSSNTNGSTFGALVPSFLVDGTMKPRLGGSYILLGSISGAGTLTGQEKDALQGGVGNVLYNIGGNNTSSTFTGTISDALSNTNPTCLLKTGSGRLTLTGKNSFTGTNTVAAGSLFLNGTNTPLFTTVYANATLGGNGALTNPVTVRSGGILSPGAQGSGSSGTFTIIGNLTNATPVMNFDLSASPAGANDRINMTGTLAMSGAQTFNFSLTEFALGAGTYGLIEGATSSTASGVTLVHNLPSATRQTFSLTRPSAGSNPSYVRLIVTGNAASLVWRGTNGMTWDTSTVNWANGSTPDTYFNLDAVTFDDTGLSSGPITLAAAHTPGVITVNAAQNYTFGGGGALAGNSPLYKLGNGTLTIGTTNPAYSGAVNLLGGTLAVAAGGSLGSGALTISNNATLSLPAASPSVAYAGNLTVPAGTTGNINSGSANHTLAGRLLAGNANSTLNLAGNVSFSGANSAQFDGFAGTLTVQPGGTLLFSSDSSGNTFGSVTPAFVVNGTLQPRDAGNTIVLGSLAGSGTIAGPQSNAGSGDTLYVIGDNAADTVFTGNISSNNAVAGSDVSVNKVGAGTLTLGGASTFAGGLTVSAGTLRVTNAIGSATGSGDVEVFSGAALTGNGFIGGSVTVDAGAILAPGAPYGTLTISNNLTLNDSSYLQFTLGTNSDRVNVGGSLFLTGQLAVTNAPGFGPGLYTLFTSGGSLTFDNLTLVSAPAGYNYSFNTNTPGAVKLLVTLTAPPAFSGINLNGNALTLSGSNGVPLGNYYILQSTNLVDWKAVATNQCDTNGAFNFTTNIPAGSPQSFFRLQLP
jgi:autotransporter-associated beta strand protein